MRLLFTTCYATLENIACSVFGEIYFDLTLKQTNVLYIIAKIECKIITSPVLHCSRFLQCSGSSIKSHVRHLGGRVILFRGDTV